MVDVGMPVDHQYERAERMGVDECPDRRKIGFGEHGGNVHRLSSVRDRQGTADSGGRVQASTMFGMLAMSEAALMSNATLW
jgi:hypothetical protein